MVVGEILVCQLAWRRGQGWLRPPGDGRDSLPVVEQHEIWAVVTALVRTNP